MVDVCRDVAEIPASLDDFLMDAENLNIYISSRNCVITVVCVKLGKWYAVKHNCVTEVYLVIVYSEQLHVSACAGHLQAV